MNTYPAYTPYGASTAPGPATPSQYTGQENDGTGLYYYRARYYNPVWGRFISSDPLGFGGRMNTYGYVGDNPITYSDPYGLFGWADMGLPQWVVNPVVGFGGGAYHAVTFGFGNLQQIRDVLDISNGGANPCSRDYRGAYFAGGVVGGGAIGGAVANKVEVSIWVRRYPNAGGGGVGLDRRGRNLIRLDWHKFKLGRRVVNVPHIDIPGVVKHWPWR